MLKPWNICFGYNLSGLVETYQDSWPPVRTRSHMSGLGAICHESGQHVTSRGEERTNGQVEERNGTAKLTFNPARIAQ